MLLKVIWKFMWENQMEKYEISITYLNIMNCKICYGKQREIRGFDHQIGTPVFPCNKEALIEFHEAMDGI